MEKKLMATDRMTNDQLWKTMTGCLATLARSRLGELTFVERRGMARRALECAIELRRRGEQLKLPPAR